MSTTTRTILRALGVLAAGILCVSTLALVAFSWQAGRREVRAAVEAAPPGGRYVRAGDVDLFVQEAGPADGPAVLFIHGTGAWSEAWRSPMSALAERGLHAIALDLPPFGFSQRPAEPRYGKLDQGRRIVALLDAMKIGRVVLVGHSFGGGPTVEAALLDPRRVQALVLVDAALGLPERPRRDGKRTLLDRLLAMPQPRDALVATFLTNPMFTRKLLQGFIDDTARATDEWVALYRRPLVVRGTSEAVGAWLPALMGTSSGAASEQPASYKALSMPVLLIWGERDRITPLAQGERLKQLLPSARLAVMKNVGHIPQIEDPAAFNALLAEFAR